MHLHYLNFPPTFLDSIGVWGGFVTTVAHGAALSLLWGGFFEKVITEVPLHWAFSVKPIRLVVVVIVRVVIVTVVTT